MARPPRRARRLFFLLLALVGVFNVDCAQQRAPRDRTQPGAVRKDFFVGSNLRDSADDPEFYMNNFVVDAPSDQSLMPAGTYDQVERIRWEIQEDRLLARRAYENVTGAEGNPQRARAGTIVAAYRILSHFDRAWAYNPTTGERLNVYEENTTDRPWYDREEMHVDWSENLVLNPGWAQMFYGTVFGNLSFESVRYTPNDPNSPEAPHTGEMDQGYFDVTSHWLVSPATNNDYGTPIPTCLFANLYSGANTYECNPQETVIRTSFRRVVDRDFEPLELTRAPYDLVGGPRATRTGYDPATGITDVNFHRYAMLHNVWQRSHVDPPVACGDSSDDANHDGTADACENAGHPGSQCDTVMHRCTLPYREREVRPIAYFLNAEMPPEFQDHVASAPDADGNVTYRLPTADDAPGAVVRGASEEIIASWNLAIMNAIAHAREVECRRLGASRGGGDRDACHERFFERDLAPQEDGAYLAPRALATNGPAVVLCHNPVRAGDHAACGAAGDRARLGDVRHNHLTYFNGASRAGYGGIAHWGYDPLTGEVVSNGGSIMGRSVDTAAGTQRDYIRVILSQLTPPLDHVSVDDFVAGAPAAALAQRIRNPGADRAAMSDAEIERRAQAIDGVHAATQNGIPLARFGSDLAGAGLEHDRVLAAGTTPAGATSQTDLAFQAAAGALRDTPIEAQLIDDHWLANAGFDPASPRTPALLDAASPLRRFDPAAVEALRARFTAALEQRGFCMQDDGAPAMIGSVDLQGVARWFARRYPDLAPEARARRIYQDLRVEAFKGIALHEVGHSLGLYHLPVSSYDSMNYLPQYWQLRTRNGEATQSCRPACTLNNINCPSVRSADRDADNCMGPRYLDPETSDELGVAPSEHPHAGINYFANTSAMEYQWDRFDETIGLGQYDSYAMGVLYGRVLETMEADAARGGMPVEDQARFAPRMESQLGDQDQIVWLDPAVTTRTQRLPIHYTELARRMNVFDPARCRAATPAERERYRWRLVNDQICSAGPRDHAALLDFETSSTDGVATHVAPSWRTREGTPTGELQLRRAYRVAPDAGVGYPHINYFDQGADIYETTVAMIRKYELSYPAQYFRRGNREWASNAIASNISSRIFRVIRGYHWSIAREAMFHASLLNSTQLDQINADDNFARSYRVAGSAIFDFFAGVLLRPEVGAFAPSTDRATPELALASRPLFDAVSGTSTQSLFNVGVISGRFISEEFDRAAGGSWDYQRWIMRAGSYAEKPYAVIALADTRPTFSSISRDLFLDGRESQVNFFTDMPQAYDRLLGGILAEDWAAVAMHVDRRATRNDRTAELTPIVPRLWDPSGDVARMGDDGTTSLTSADDAPLLFPNVGFRQQLPAVVYAMIFSSLNTNPSTMNKLRIFVEGSGDQITFPESERVRFTDPSSGLTYVARRYGPDPGYPAALVGNRVIDRGIASRMLEHANALVRDAFATNGTNPDGTPLVVRGPDGNPAPRRPLPADQAAQANAVSRLTDYIGLITTARNAARTLDHRF